MLGRLTYWSTKIIPKIVQSREIKCNADSKSYLKYKHFGTHTDRFRIIYFPRSHFVNLGAPPGKPLNLFSMFLDKKVENNIRLYLIAYLAFFSCKKWR